MTMSSPPLLLPSHFVLASPIDPFPFYTKDNKKSGRAKEKIRPRREWTPCTQADLCSHHLIQSITPHASAHPCERTNMKGGGGGRGWEEGRLILKGGFRLNWGSVVFHLKISARCVTSSDFIENISNKGTLLICCNNFSSHSCCFPFTNLPMQPSLSFRLDQICTNCGMLPICLVTSYDGSLKSKILEWKPYVGIVAL